MGFVPNQYVSILVFGNSWVYLPLKEVGFMTRRTARENREKGKAVQESMEGWSGEMHDYLCTMHNPADLLSTDPLRSMAKERLTMLGMDSYLESTCLRYRPTATPSVVSQFDWPIHKPYTMWTWDENSVTTPAMFMHGIHLLGQRSDVFLVLDTSKYGANGDTGGLFEILSDNGTIVTDSFRNTKLLLIRMLHSLFCVEVEQLFEFNVTVNNSFRHPVICACSGRRPRELDARST